MSTPPAEAAPPVSVVGLGHRYGERQALAGLDLDVSRGEIVALLGPNGSGKSTLFRILSTLITPTAGRALVFGADVARAAPAARRRIGVVFQSPALDDQLTARENLRLHGRLHGLGGRRLEERIEVLLERMGVLERAEERTGRLSGGLARRVDLARGLLHEPDLLLLDEPTSGLDPAARRDLWALLEDLQDRGLTLLLTTHLMDEAERCQRVIILDRGTLVASGTPAALRAGVGGDVLTIGTDRPVEAAALLHRELGLAAAVRGDQLRLEHPGAAELVPRVAAALGARLHSLTLQAPTLEDVFLHRTGRAFAEEMPPGGPA